MHTCPMVTVLVPHVGGPILPPGAPTVLIGFLPAATVTSLCVCVGPPDVIVKGSAGVFISFLPAARMGDMTAHGGVIVLGCPTAMIGEIGAPSPGAGGVVAGLAATGAGTPFTPVPSKVGAGSGAGPGVDLCAGKGMATPDKEQEFADDMKALQKDWKTLTVDDPNSLKASPFLYVCRFDESNDSVEVTFSATLTGDRRPLGSCKRSPAATQCVAVASTSVVRPGKIEGHACRMVRRMCR